MAHSIGRIDNTNGKPAHKNFIKFVADFADEHGWDILESSYPDSGEWQVFLKGYGFSGEEEIYVGLRSYGLNFCIAVMAATGYVVGQPLSLQPNLYQVGIPLREGLIDYWLTVNPQRIAFVCRPSESYYESGYIGKFFPYTNPTINPYPLICAGMFGYNNTDTLLDLPYTSTNSAYQMPYKGSTMDAYYMDEAKKAYNFAMYSVFSGRWTYMYSMPFVTLSERVLNDRMFYPNTKLGEKSAIRPCELVRPDKIYISYDATRIYPTPTGIYGCLDGVFWITGTDISAGDYVEIDEVRHYIFCNRHPTDIREYYVLAMDPD